MAKRNKQDNWIISSCLIGTLALLLNLVCVVFVAYKLKILQTGSPIANTRAPISDLYVCSKILGHVNLDNENLFYNETKKELCAKTIDGVSALIELNLKQHDQVLEAFKILSNASGHFQLIPDKTNDKRLRVKNDKPENHSQGLAVDSNGFVNITSQGTYFVYCSVYFRAYSSRPCDIADKQHMTWTLSVHKNSSTNSTEDLMKVSHTCCENCIKEIATSYTAGVFQLNAGDVITVMVSGKGVIYFDEKTSYLGLMMLNKMMATS